MAPKVTSASDRSKRKAKTTVTSDKGRKNRSSVSKAEVTRSGEGVKPGSAKVTQSRPTGSPRALPPAGGTSGRPAVDRRAAAQMKLERSARGRRGPDRVAKPQGALPPGRQGGAMVKADNASPENPRRTNARARQAEAAKGSRGSGVRTGQPAPTAPKVSGGLLRGLGKAVGIAGTVAAIGDTARNIVDPNSDTSTNLRNAKNAVMRRYMGGGKDKTSGKGVSTSWQGPTPSGKQRRPSPTPTPSPSPSPRPSGGGGGGSRPSPSPAPSPRPSGGGSSGSRPAPSPTPAPKPEASRTSPYGADGKQLYNKGNNPLMRRTFGYETGNAPDQKKKSESSEPAKSGGGRAAMAGSKSGPVTAKASAEKSIMERIAEMKKRRQSS